MKKGENPNKSGNRYSYLLAELVSFVSVLVHRTCSTTYLLYIQRHVHDGWMYSLVSEIRSH